MEDGTKGKEIISTFDLRIEVGDAESGSLKLVQLIKPKWSAEDIKLKVVRFTIISCIETHYLIIPLSLKASVSVSLYLRINNYI